MTKFNKIGLVGRPDHKGVVTSLKRLTSYLVNKEKSVFVDEATASLLDNPSANVVTKSELSVSCDLVIVVGGDGSGARVHEHEGAGAVGDLRLADAEAALPHHRRLLVADAPRERRAAERAAIGDHSELLGARCDLWEGPKSGLDAEGIDGRRIPRAGRQIHHHCARCVRHVGRVARGRANARLAACQIP